MTQHADLITAALAAELRAERARARMSADTLAEAAGIATNTAYRYLKGERAISVAILRVWAPTFGLMPGELIERAQECVARDQQHAADEAAAGALAG